MLRRSLVEEKGLSYNTAFNRTEDYELWIRAAEFTKLDNIPRVLHKMRHHGQSITSTASEVMTAQTCTLLTGQLKKFGLSVTDEEVQFHHAVGRGKRLQSREDAERAEQWLRLLRKKNREYGLHDEHIFDIVLGMIWFRLCRNSTPLGWWILDKYRQFEVSTSYKPMKREMMIFYVSLLRHWGKGEGRWRDGGSSD